MLKRLSFAMECAGLLYLAAVVIAVGKLWWAHSISLIALVGAVTPPSAACVLFVIAGMLVPNVLGEMRFRPPLNVTLPIVFVATLALPLYLVSSGEVAIQQPNPMLANSLLWASPLMLVLTCALQIVLFSLFTWRAEAASANR